MSVLIDSLAEARAKIAARLVEVESEARQARARVGAPGAEATVEECVNYILEDK